MSDPSRTLWCVIDGNSTPFSVQVKNDIQVADLQRLIRKLCKHGVLAKFDAKDLVLWKLHNPEPVQPQDELGGRIKALGGADSDFRSFATKLVSTGEVQQIFPRPLLVNHIHIIVSPSPVDEFPHKRPRLDNQQPLTPNIIQGRPTPDSPRLTDQETQDAMAGAIQPFKDYLKYLADGKLDGYFNSIQPEDKVLVPGVFIANTRFLLLHRLGDEPDMSRINELFVGDNVHLFNTTGAGKTRLSLDGLCCHWGFYISCFSHRTTPSGSRDFQLATEILSSTSSWNQGASLEDRKKNASAADRTFAMLLCARIFVLQQFLECLSPDVDMEVARRRWLFLQTLPPCFGEDDIFVVILQQLLAADCAVMTPLITSMLCGLERYFPVAGRINGKTPLFVVIDEAQQEANQFLHHFPATEGEGRRPILHELYGFLQNLDVFRGIILAGTRLTMDLVDSSVGSVGAKLLDKSQRPLVFTNTGCFVGTDHQGYINRYLNLSSGNASDQRLLQRIQYWFSGRYRPTVSLIELLLYSANAPRHRVLTAFVEHLTGFRITDAIDLESQEDAIPLELNWLMRYYGRLRPEKLFQIAESAGREDLLSYLIDVLMRWTMGSQPTSIPVENHTHEMIALGVGRFSSSITSRSFNRNVNYPVHIDEPLIIISLMTLFDDHQSNWRRKQMSHLLRTTSDQPSRGVPKEVVLLALMENFGDKWTALGDVFSFRESSPWTTRMVSLVSLKRGDGGVIWSAPVSWRTGSSDRFFFKAQSPSEILEFLSDPKGKPFLFPDTHMGPDLMCFFQDKETGELIMVAVQSKITVPLDSRLWMKAVDSITPECFYTMAKDGQKEQYAPVSYPCLSEEVEKLLKVILGDGVYEPVVDRYRKKLQSSTHCQQEHTLLPDRYTPRLLRVVATPDDEQRRRLEADWGGDPVAVLNWRKYLGLTADVGARSVI